MENVRKFGWFVIGIKYASLLGCMQAKVIMTRSEYRKQRKTYLRSGRDVNDLDVKIRSMANTQGLAI